jgi:hypothetical protein
MHKSGDMNTNLTLFCFAAVGFFLAAACNCKAQQSHTDEKTKVERRALARLSPSYTEKNEGRAERRPSSFSPTLVGTERT